MKRRFSGQSLIEYAFAITLVSIVVIAAAFALGLITQRVYGIIKGALGGTGDGSLTTHSITIDPGGAQCIAVASAHHTGLWVTGSTDENLANVTGLTETGPSTVNANGSGFVFNPMVDSNNANVNECPASVVIQAKDGTIAVAPLTRVSE